MIVTILHIISLEFHLFSLDVKSSWKNGMQNKSSKNNGKISAEGVGAVRAKLNDSLRGVLLLLPTV